MTMQTFVVLFLGIALGPKIGLATVSVYLLEGIFGLPVFANSPEKGIGLIYFTGPTMGYLIGFMIAAYFAGSQKKLKNEDVVVIIMPDHGSRYIGKIYNDNWMKKQKFMPEP